LGDQQPFKVWFTWVGYDKWMTDVCAESDCAAASADNDASGAVAELRRRVVGTNISDTSLLATDYLNHFNEVVMLIDMIPDMPECLDDVREWRPKSYAQHFADSGLPEADLAIAAYELSPEVFRLPLDKTVDNLNRLVFSSLDRITSSIESGDQVGLADVASRASRDMQRLIEAASAIINGATSTIDKTEIESMFGC
jgi:hypothetical protein